MRSKAWIWRLLIYAEHDRLVGGIQVETDDVKDFADEMRVGAEFEGLHPMGWS